MTTSASAPQRLYLLRVANMPPVNIPVPCYLIQTGDGKNILIDSGLPPGTTQGPPGMGAPIIEKNVIEQLAMIGLQPTDIAMLICTHFDQDHAGNHSAFANAELIVQRQHYEVASGGHERFARSRPQWDVPVARYRQVDGDTELLPGLTLIETSGHVPGHQSVLVCLPNTGPVLLTIDAVTIQEHFTPDRPIARFDADEEGARASTRKLLDIAQREHVALVIFGHDGPQWQTLKKLPEFYD